MTVSPGTRIRELRMISGLSQEELGRRIGVQRAAVNKYEIGTVQNIPITTIEKLAQVFNVSPNYIMGWDYKDADPLSTEVRVIQGVKHFYGKESVELLENFTLLTPKGKKRVLQYMDDIYCTYEDTEKVY